MCVGERNATLLRNIVLTSPVACQTNYHSYNDSVLVLMCFLCEISEGISFQRCQC
jgi:hypothetical protein